MAEFGEYVKRMHADRDKLFEAEFDVRMNVICVLSSVSPLLCDCSLLPRSPSLQLLLLKYLTIGSATDLETSFLVSSN